MKVEDAVEQLGLVLVDGALFGADVDHHAQFSLGHGGVGRAAAREEVREDRERGDQRAHHPHDDLHRDRRGEGDALRRAGGEHLRRVLAELGRDQRDGDEPEEVPQLPKVSTAITLPAVEARKIDTFWRMTTTPK